MAYTMAASSLRSRTTHHCLCEGQCGLQLLPLPFVLPAHKSNKEDYFAGKSSSRDAIVDHIRLISLSFGSLFQNFPKC